MKNDLTFDEVFYEFKEIDSTQSESIAHVIVLAKTEKAMLSALFLNTLSLYFITRNLTKTMLSILKKSNTNIDQNDSLIFIQIRDKKRNLAKQLFNLSQNKGYGFFLKKLLTFNCLLIELCAKKDDLMALTINQYEANLLDIPQSELLIDEIMKQLNRPDNKDRLDKAIQRHKLGRGINHNLIV